MRCVRERGCRRSATAPQESRVSRSTVVEAYDQLIAAGLIESRRGSGFYVRLRASKLAQRRAAAQPLPGTVLDVSWLLRAQRRQSPGSEQPGAGLLPEDWLDHEMVAAAVRGVGRSRGSWLLKYGAVEGYLPLREALSTRLAQAGIEVARRADRHQRRRHRGHRPGGAAVPRAGRPGVRRGSRVVRDVRALRGLRRAHRRCAARRGRAGHRRARKPAGARDGPSCSSSTPWRTTPRARA